MVLTRLACVPAREPADMARVPGSSGVPTLAGVPAEAGVPTEAGVPASEPMRGSCVPAGVESGGGVLAILVTALARELREA